MNPDDVIMKGILNRMIKLDDVIISFNTWLLATFLSDRGILLQRI